MDKDLHLRNKLGEEELPPELAWENVAEGILAEVGRNSATNGTGAEQTWSAIKYVSLITTMFFTVAIALLLFVPNDELAQNNHPAQSSTILTQNTSKEKAVTNFDSDILITNATNTSPEKAEASSNNDLYPANETMSANSKDKLYSSKKSLANQSNSTINKSKTKIQAAKNIHRQQLQTTTATNYTIADLGEWKTTDKASASQILKKQDHQNQSTELAQKATSNSELLQRNAFSLAAISVNSLLVQFQREQIEMKSAINHSPAVIYPTKSSRLALELGVGTNLLYFKNNGSDLSALRQGSEHRVFGTSSNLTIRYLLNDNWSISSGIQYHSLVSKLDYYNKWDTIVDATKRIIEINSLNGESTDYFKETQVETFAYDSVLHYNSVRVFSVPLLVTKSWASYKGLRLETNIGLNYGIATTSDGKTIDRSANGEKGYSVRSLSSKEYKSRTNLLAGIGLSYPLGKRLYLSGTLSGSYGLNTWTNTSSIESSHPFILNAGLNLGYRL